MSKTAENIALFMLPHSDEITTRKSYSPISCSSPSIRARPLRWGCATSNLMVGRPAASSQRTFGVSRLRQFASACATRVCIAALLEGSLPTGRESAAASVREEHILAKCPGFPRRQHLRVCVPASFCSFASAPNTRAGSVVTRAVPFAFCRGFLLPTVFVTPADCPYRGALAGTVSRTTQSFP